MNYLPSTLRVLAVAALLLSSACASRAQLDARFDAGWRPKLGSCTFGGDTPKIAAWCAKQSSLASSGGYEAYLRGLNLSARRSLRPGAWCGEHVAAVIRLVGADPELKAEPLYNCPKGYAPGVECHVSVLVSDTAGNRYVIDNGAVVRDGATGHAGVTTLANFSGLVGGRYWTGPKRFLTGTTLASLAIAEPGTR